MPFPFFTQPGPLYGGQQAQQQPSPFSGLGNIMNLVGPALSGFGAALAADDPRMAPLVTGNALAARGERRTENQTYNWLKSTRPDLAAQVDQGMPIGIAMQEAMAKPDKGTSMMQNYEYARQQGYGGTFDDFRRATAPQTNITMEGNKYGPIPSGMMLRETPDGAMLVAIPDGPQDIKRQQAEQSRAETLGAQDTSSDVITKAAARAREAAGNRQLGPYGQGIVENIPWTDSAEVRRQVDVLGSMASIEGINAMRRQSESGGALGNVTEGELRILRKKQGALDPNSPNFQRDLDDYERTLLRIVHGKEVGDRIFAASRIERPTNVPEEVWNELTSEERALFQ